MAWLTGTDTLKEYQRYRKSGRQLHQKIIDACLGKTTLEKAVSMLGLGQKSQLIFDSEDDMSVLMDFALHEIHLEDGINSIERYAKEKGGANAIERELLAAMAKAKTGLFGVDQILRDKHQITLVNLISPDVPTILTDINFSQTMSSGLVIFFRPLRVTKYTMTSGIAFVFPGELAQELITQWNQLESKGSAERYAWFFKQSKQTGFKTMYV